MRSQQVNIELLKRSWAIHTFTSREEWLQWLKSWRTQFIRQSPSSAIRSCATLAETSEQLAKYRFFLNM